MKEKLLLIVVMITTYCLNAQNDSIVKYLNKKFEITTEKSKALFIDIRKKIDTTWEVTRYYRDGKLYSKSYSKSEEFDEFIGKYLTFYRNGKLEEKRNYTIYHKKHGKVIHFFDNGNRSFSGFYNNGSRIKLWKYYHYNGNLASKFYYGEKGGLKKIILFDEAGNQLKNTDYVEFRHPVFKKGIVNFREKLSNIISGLSYSINTVIDVSFIVDVDGSIRDVWVINNVPKKLKKEIVSFFESVNGWEAAIDMGRKIPFRYSIGLNFKTRE